MTDRESELIERAFAGDMEAFDKLLPNARPKDRANFENAIKGDADVSQIWCAVVLWLLSKNKNSDENKE